MPWPTKKLGEICNFEGGTQPPKSVFKYEPQKGYVRLLQIRDFVSDEKATYVPDSPKLRKCTADDVLIGRYGASVGKILRGKAGAYNVAIIKTIPNERLLLKDYLYTFLQSPSVQGRFVGFTKRAAQAGFTKEEVGSIEIPLPPIAEQKRIVEKIEKLFAKIDEASRLRAQSLAASAALLPSALHQVFSHAEKENWPTKKLGEVAKVFAGSSAPQATKYFENGKYPFIRVSDLNGGKTKNLTSARDQINDLAIQEFRLIKAKKGSILFPKSGAAILTNSRAILGIDAYIVNHLAVVEANESYVLSDYLFLFLSNFDMGELVNDPTYPSLKLSEIKEIEIPLPPLSEQKKIVAYLDALSTKVRELQNLQSQTATDFSALRQSILRYALNGRI